MSLLTIIFFFLAWFGVWLPIGTLLSRFLGYNLLQPLTLKQKLITIGSLYPFAPLIIWLITGRGDRYFLRIGLQLQPTLLISLGVGFLLASIGLSLTFILEFCFGLIKFRQQNIKALWTSAFPILCLGLGISAIEEIVFRGFLVTQLTADFSLLLAAIISSTIFSLSHILWERKQTFPQLPGLWLMGMVLVGARIVDNYNLGLCWGLHTGWIWGLSCLDTAELIDYQTIDRPWLTGLNGQPLAGIAGIFCLLITGLSLWTFQ